MAGSDPALSAAWVQAVPAEAREAVDRILGTPGGFQDPDLIERDVATPEALRALIAELAQATGRVARVEATDGTAFALVAAPTELARLGADRRREALDAVASVLVAALGAQRSRELLTQLTEELDTG